MSIPLDAQTTVDAFGWIEHAGKPWGHVSSLPLHRNHISEKILAAWRLWLRPGKESP